MRTGLNFKDLQKLINNVKELDVANPTTALLVKFLNDILEQKNNIRDIEKILLVVLYNKLSKMDLMEKFEELTLVRKDGKVFVPAFGIAITIDESNVISEWENYKVNPEDYITLPLNLTTEEVLKHQIEALEEVDMQEITKIASMPVSGNNETPLNHMV